MPLVLTVEPTGEPLTLTEAKLHLRVDDTADDSLITILLTAARKWAEGECRRAFMTQTWRLTLDRFPPLGQSLLPSTGLTSAGAQAKADVALKRPPVASVSSVQYVDPNGATQTLATSEYVTDLASLPIVISPAYGKSWPATRDQKNAVTIDFVAGYGGAAAVPADIKAAILLQLGDLYQNREAQIVGTIVSANATAAALLGPYRVVEAV